jgi:hypothetical protein
MSDSDQPPDEGVTVTDNPDGSQTVHARAVLQAAVTTGNEEENG